VKLVALQRRWNDLAFMLRLTDAPGRPASARTSWDDAAAGPRNATPIVVHKVFVM